MDRPHSPVENRTRRLGAYQDDEEQQHQPVKKQKAAPRVVIRSKIKKVGAAQYDHPSSWDEEEVPKPPPKKRGQTFAPKNKKKAPAKKAAVAKEMRDSSPESQDVIRVAPPKMIQHQKETMPSPKRDTKEEGKFSHVRNSIEKSGEDETDGEREESPIAEQSLLMDGLVSSFTDSRNLQSPQPPPAVEPEDGADKEEVHEPDDSDDPDYVSKGLGEATNDESENEDHEDDTASHYKNTPSSPPGSPGRRGPGRKSFAAAQQFHDELREEGASDFSDDPDDLPEELSAIKSKIVDSFNGRQNYLTTLDRLLEQQNTLLDIQTQTAHEPGYYQHLATVLSSLQEGKYPPETEALVLGQLNKVLGRIQELRDGDQRIEIKHQRLARRHGRKLANHRKCEDAILKAFDKKRFSGSNDPRSQKAAEDAEKARKIEQRVEKRNREIAAGVERRLAQAREVQREKERLFMDASQRRRVTSSTVPFARTFMSSVFRNHVDPRRTTDEWAQRRKRAIAEQLEWRVAEAAPRESMAPQLRQRESVVSSYSAPNPTPTARTSLLNVPDVAERVVVEGFGERGRARPPVDEEDSEVWEYDRPWSQEESDVVIEGMERFDHRDLKRWAKIKAAYPDVLRYRREEDIVARAIEMRTVLEEAAEIPLTEWWYGF
jgi:hypothetical protein